MVRRRRRSLSLSLLFLLFAVVAIIICTALLYWDLAVLKLEQQQVTHSSYYQLTTTTTTATPKASRKKKNGGENKDSRNGEKQEEENKEEEEAPYKMIELPPDCFVDDSARKNAYKRNEVLRYNKMAALLLPKSMDAKRREVIGFCRELGQRLSSSNNDDSNNDVLTTVRVDIQCGITEHWNMGGGNWLMLLYGSRLVARAMGDVEIEYRCTDNNTTAIQKDYVLPWVAGSFLATTKECAANTVKAINNRNSQQQLIPSPIVNVTEACTPFIKIPIANMIQDIRYDLRRMAIALLEGCATNPTTAAHRRQINEICELERQGEGNTAPNGRRRQLPIPPRPILPNVQLDDVAIHFRCGDLMEWADHPNYCFVRYEYYSERISPQARSIGIITQPFMKTSQSRRKDILSAGRCRIVVEDFASYLQERFPRAAVRIRNDESESVALAYSRMIMANQTFIVSSTFVVFPALAAFGTAYVHATESPWCTSTSMLLRPRPDLIASNVVLIDHVPHINAPHIMDLWRKNETGSDVLSWFRGTGWYGIET